MRIRYNIPRLHTCALALLALFTSTMVVWGQSTTPSIISFHTGVQQKTEAETFALSSDTSPFPSWLFPFWTGLAKAMDANGTIFGELSEVSIRPSIDTSKTASVYVELASIIPWNYFRIGLGTNITQSSLSDSTKTPRDIAFQTLMNGGGNLVLNISRPIVYVEGIGSGAKGFLLANLEIIGYADIKELYQTTYNPGWGALVNLSIDFRQVNTSWSERQQGNGFRCGLNTRGQYTAFNEKYTTKNNLDKAFDNLGTASVGVYIGLAMFNIQYSYNFYTKTDNFFNDKKHLLRVEAVPVHL